MERRRKILEFKLVWSLLTPNRQAKFKTISHKYIFLNKVSYEYIFIYDIKKRKLAQKLRCDSFIAIYLVDQEYIRIKLWDKKKQKEGFPSIKMMSSSAAVYVNEAFRVESTTVKS